MADSQTLKVMRKNPFTAVGQGVLCYGEQSFANVVGRKQVAVTLVLGLCGGLERFQWFYGPLDNAIQRGICLLCDTLF